MAQKGMGVSRSQTEIDVPGQLANVPPAKSRRSEIHTPVPVTGNDGQEQGLTGLRKGVTKP
jgi:hypothetical protein